VAGEDVQLPVLRPPSGPRAVHTRDDTAAGSENNQAFYAALLASTVSADYLEPPSGGHGLNGYKGPMWDAWQARSLA
jgi:hypothetical protein